MSEHDPFDGLYDDAPAEPEAQPEPEASSDAPEPAVEVSVYTNTQLARMHKADLQAVAAERGLDTEGSREELIERIKNAQGASA